MTTQIEISEYQQQALDFLNNTGATIEIKFSHNGKHFDDDKDVRDIYNVIIKRGNRDYNFNFGTSIIDSQYYADTIPGRTYTLSGKSRTGNYSINDINKYQSGGQKLTLVKGKTPDEYSILACLQKYDVGTFENFCSEFGYYEDSKKAEKMYRAVSKEYQKMCSLFTDAELELLQEIN